MFVDHHHITKWQQNNNAQLHYMHHLITVIQHMTKLKHTLPIPAHTHCLWP